MDKDKLGAAIGLTVLSLLLGPGFYAAGLYEAGLWNMPGSTIRLIIMSIFATTPLIMVIYDLIESKSKK